MGRSTGRSMLKEWKNGRGGRWTCRIRWYCQQGHAPARTPYNIRLALVNDIGEWNLYPETLEHANKVWSAFKAAHPPGVDYDKQWYPGYDLNEQWVRSKRKDYPWVRRKRKRRKLNEQQPLEGSDG